MSGALIEAIARAIAEGQGDDFDHAHRDKPHWIETRGEAGGRYRDINEPRQPDYIDAAQAALTAITEAGYAVVPVEPTEAMVNAVYEYVDDAMGVEGSIGTDGSRELFRAMIHATNNGNAE